MKPRIMVYGSYAVGMTMGCGSFPAAGQTVLGRDFNQLHGGKGSNQAIAAARLGGQVSYVSCVGRDMMGDAAMELFRQEGLDIRVKRSDTTSTGVGLVMVDAQGENRIIINFGASMDVAPADIDALEDVLKECSILLMQLEADMDTIAYAAQKARDNGVMVILNPAPYSQMPPALLQNVDVITPNETEAMQMLGMDPHAQVEPETLAKGLLELGIKQAIVTLGKNGAILANGDEMTRVPTPRAVSVVDTTGAGDTFSGALAVALGEGMPIKQAVAFANEAAGLSVTRYGVVDAIPYRKELSQ